MINDNLSTKKEETPQIKPIPKSLRHKISRFGLPCVDPVLIMLYLPSSKEQKTTNNDETNSSC